MADKGAGISVTFNSGFLAAVTSIRRSGLERPAVRTTTLSDTVHTYEPADIYEPGQYDCELLFAPGTEPPLISGDAAETVTVTWTDSGAATWAASGFMTNFEVIAADNEDRVRATCTIKISGPETITP